MQRIIPCILALALLVPTLETVVQELGLVNAVHLPTLSIQDAEEENKEGEKEEERKKQEEEYDLIGLPTHSNGSVQAGWVGNSFLFQSWVSEIPSPPPDGLS